MNSIDFHLDKQDGHDQIGQRFGKCIVIRFHIRYRLGGKKIGKISCLCDCGKEFNIFQMTLNQEKSYSCDDCAPYKPCTKCKK